MVSELMRFELESGGSVLVEAADQAGFSRVGRQGQLLADAATTFETALRDVRDAAASALTQLTSMPRQPDEVQLTFGVKLDAQVGAVIAKTGLQGQFEVQLTWRPEPDQQG